MASACADGIKPSAAIRSRTSDAQSRMAKSCGFGERGDEGFPSVALLRQHPPAFRSEPIAASAPLARLLDPASENPFSVLELVEEGIQRGDMKRQQPVGAAGNFA